MKEEARKSKIRTYDLSSTFPDALPINDQRFLVKEAIKLFSCAKKTCSFLGTFGAMMEMWYTFKP